MSRIFKLQALLASDPYDSFLLHALALEHIKLGEDATARSLFATLLEKNPGYHGSYYHLARLLERSGDKESAMECYRTGIIYAQQAGDAHARAELEMALEDLEDA